MRTILSKVAAVVMMAGLLAGCTGGPASVHVRTTEKNNYFQDTRTINLQDGEFPSFLAFGNHDTLWFTENGGNVIARVDAAGNLTELPIQAGNNNDPQDIISSPGGSIWFTGLAEIGKISPDGVMTVWHETSIGAGVGLPDALAAGQDGQVWYTDDGGHICRISSADQFGCYAIHPATKDIWMRGLAMGSDGALWFTEDNLGSVTDTQNAIGRLTTGGKYSQWLLPPGSGPFDIVSGPEKALWFTTDTQVGRITTAGRITLWPLSGAQQFGGLAVAPDGSLWLADGLANTIRHFIPPPAVPPAR